MSSRSGLLMISRQNDAKDRTFAEFALDMNRAFNLLKMLPHDAQAQSDTSSGVFR